MLPHTDAQKHFPSSHLAKSRLLPSYYGFKEQDPSFATKAIHAHQNPDQLPESKPTVFPIAVAVHYKHDGPTEFPFTDYGRVANPTRNMVEQVVATLEGAQYGLAFGSGMAAISTIFNMLKAGDHVVTLVDVYGGTDIYLKKIADGFNIKTTFINDVTDPENIEKAIQDNTKLVWMETPSNPTMILTDIEKVAAVVHRHEDVLMVVDNTYLSPYFQRPLELGADIVVHSATKYLNGHSDVLMGIVVTNNQQVHTRLRFLQITIGAVASPFDCYLLNRGLKTLPNRMLQHMENGLEVAKFLESHPYVERVLHPGLPSHPQHELAKRQCYGHSGMITFYLKGGRDEAFIFSKALKVVCLGASLGGYESLLKIPAIMPVDFGNLPINMVRLSVGLESVEDIIEDLDQALNKMYCTKQEAQ